MRSRYRIDTSRHAADLKFLDTVRTVNLEDLLKLERRHQGKSSPLWKRIAIQRAIHRQQVIEAEEAAE